MRRYALFILVLALLLLNSLMQHAAEANPITNPELWALRFALPAGVAGAALCLVSLGVGAQFWRGALMASGGEEWAPLGFWSRLTSCSLWCGWLPLLCAQPYMMSSAQVPYGLASPWLVGAFIALIISRMLAVLMRKSRWGAGLALALVSAGAAGVCGQELCPAVPLCPLVFGLMAAPALRLLTERDHEPQLVWVQVAAFCFCAYVAAFGYLLLWYTPSGGQETETWGLWLGGLFLALALFVIMLAPLRRSAVAPRLFALVGLLAGGIWLWLEFAPAVGVLPVQRSVSIGSYVATLVILGIPSILLIFERRKMMKG